MTGMYTMTGRRRYSRLMPPLLIAGAATLTYCLLLCVTSASAFVISGHVSDRKCDCDGVTRGGGNVVDCRQRHLVSLYDCEFPVDTLEIDAGLNREFGDGRLTRSVLPPRGRLRRMRVLRLDGCELASVEERALSGLSSVMTLTLSDNHITRVSRHAFSGLRRLVQLWLNGNRLTSVPEGLFSGLPRLRSVHLERNLLITLSIDTFVGSAIHSVHLDFNHIRNITTSSRTELYSLRSLHLAYNRLRALPPGLGQSVYNLELLNLTGNLLETLDADWFHGMRRLGRYFADSNRIQVAPSSLIDVLQLAFAAGGRVSLRNNPFHCNCEVTWLRDWLLERQHVGSDRDYVCRTPTAASFLANCSTNFICRAPQLVAITADVAVRRGRSVVLSCAAEGDPPPTVEWVSPGRGGETFTVIHRSPDRQRTRTSAVWRVAVTSSRRAGLYRCRASNVAGRAVNGTVVSIADEIIQTPVGPPTASPRQLSVTRQLVAQQHLSSNSSVVPRTAARSLRNSSEPATRSVQHSVQQSTLLTPVTESNRPTADSRINLALYQNSSQQFSAVDHPIAVDAFDVSATSLADTVSLPIGENYQSLQHRSKSRDASTPESAVEDNRYSVTGNVTDWSTIVERDTEKSSTSSLQREIVRGLLETTVSMMQSSPDAAALTTDSGDTLDYQREVDAVRDNTSTTWISSRVNSRCRCDSEAGNWSRELGNVTDGRGCADCAAAVQLIAGGGGSRWSSSSLWDGLAITVVVCLSVCTAALVTVTCVAVFDRRRLVVASWSRCLLPQTVTI